MMVYEPSESSKSVARALGYTIPSDVTRESAANEQRGGTMSMAADPAAIPPQADAAEQKTEKTEQSADAAAGLEEVAERAAWLAELDAATWGPMAEALSEAARANGAATSANAPAEVDATAVATPDASDDRAAPDDGAAPSTQPSTQRVTSARGARVSQTEPTARVARANVAVSMKGSARAEARASPAASVQASGFGVIRSRTTDLMAGTQEAIEQRAHEIFTREIGAMGVVDEATDLRALRKRAHDKAREELGQADPALRAVRR